MKRPLRSRILVKVSQAVLLAGLLFAGSQLIGEKSSQAIGYINCACTSSFFTRSDDGCRGYSTSSYNTQVTDGSSCSAMNFNYDYGSYAGSLNCRTI